MNVNRDLLREKRQEKGINFSEMARLLNAKSTSTYRMKENGDRRFMENDVLKICNILGITPNQFFEWD